MLALKKPLDRIYEAYFNELGDKFAENVRTRIHWICEKATGEQILDIGCSQGITSIILGREGKHVLGIDLLEDSIQFANESLAKEEVMTQEHVQFMHANFMAENIEENKYDAVIFGEVLEHITEPSRFIQKAETLIKDSGRIIVTVPFGINDYFDHKKTYYLNDLLNLQTDKVHITEIKYFGKWVGIILEKNVAESKQLFLNHETLATLEEAFLAVEREHITNNQVSHSKYEEMAATFEKINSENTRLQNEHIAITQELNETKQSLEQVKSDNEAEINSLKEEVNKLRAQLNNKAQNVVNNEFVEQLQKQLQVEKKEKIQVKEQLIESYTKESRLLKTINKAQKNHEREMNYYRTQLVLSKKEVVQVKENLYDSYTKEERLLRTHHQLTRKYKALSESKLGSLQLSYWRKRTQRKNRKKRG